MQNTQLTCPHCGSTLAFGGSVAAGTSVHCMICTRAFTAADPVSIPALAPKKPVPTAKPAPVSVKPTSPNAGKSVPRSTPAPASSGSTLSPRLLIAGGAAVLALTLASLVCVGVVSYVMLRDKGRTEQQVAEVPIKKEGKDTKGPTDQPVPKIILKKDTPAPREIGGDEDDGQPAPGPVLVRTPKNKDAEIPKTPDDSPAPKPKDTKEKPPAKEMLIVPFLPEKEISDRVIKAGGKIGKVTVSLAWNNRNDLDLHVVTSTGEKIYYAHPRSKCGGRLDIDQNVSPTTSKPVENIFWTAESPPKGAIKIYVHHYSNHGLPDCKDPTPFVVRVQLGDEIKLFSGSVSRLSNPLAFVAEVPILTADLQKKKD